jgi:hypothetical protein
VSRRVAVAGLFAGLLGAGCTQVLGLEGYGNGADSLGALDAMAADVAVHKDAARADGPRVPPREAGTGDGSAEASSVLEAGRDASDPEVDVGSPCASSPGFACVAVAPPGWTGPVAIFEGSGEPLPTVPSCAGSFPTDTFDGFDVLDAPSPTCACSCGAPTGSECAGSASFFQDGVCAKTCGKPATLSPGTCTSVNVSGCPGGGAMLSISASASGGACAPSLATSVSPWAWTKEVRACGLAEPASELSCAAGTACVPVPSLPYEFGNLCVVREGTWACPAAFPAQRVYYTGASDTRSCSACSCGAATDVACTGGTTKSYFDSSCAVLVSSVSSPESCGGGRSGFVAAMELSGITASGGSCAASSVTPTGEVSSTQPTTLCCSQ